MNTQALSDTFTHRTTVVNGIKLHYVIGGHGAPVILLHGYPQTSYAWRKVMPKLTNHYTVIAPDLRGLGDSDKPVSGFDKRTIATDIHQLIQSLGFSTIFLVGHDYGGSIAYAFAAEYPTLVHRLVVIECAPAGLGETNSIPLVAGGGMWHRAFHLVPDLPEALVAGRERLYLSWFYHHYSRQRRAISANDIDEYVRTYSLPGAMRSGFEYYRAYFEDTALGNEYCKTKLTMPILAIGADSVFADAVQQCMERAAVNVQGVIIESCGHFVPEEQPFVLTQHLLNFFAEDTEENAIATN